MENKYHVELSNCICVECKRTFRSFYKGDNICTDCYRERIIMNQEEERKMKNCKITCPDCFKEFKPEGKSDILCSNCYESHGRNNLRSQVDEVTDLFIKELSEHYISGDDEIEIQFGGQGFKFELDLDLVLDLQRLFNDRRKR